MKRLVGLVLALTLLATAASGKTDFYDLLKNRNVMVTAVALLLVGVPPRCPNNPPSPPGDMIAEFIIMLGHENDAAFKRDVTVQITRLVNEWDDDPPGMNRSVCEYARRINYYLYDVRDEFEKWKREKGY
jgi:hypothetical protein